MYVNKNHIYFLCRLVIKLLSMQLFATHILKYVPNVYLNNFCAIQTFLMFTPH